MPQCVEESVCLFEDILLVVFMNLAFTCMPGESEDVPMVECMYLGFSHMPGELPKATRVFVVVFV